MLPTAELLVVETTRSAACPKQLSTKRYRKERKKRVALIHENPTLQMSTPVAPVALHEKVREAQSVVLVCVRCLT